MINRIICSLVFALFALCSANAQLVDVISEVVYSDGDNPLMDDAYPEGFSTYRIYATFQNDTDELNAVFGIWDCDPLMLGTSTDDMWNSDFGGILATDLNPELFDLFPSSEWDSFITIGATSSADTGAELFIATLDPPPSGLSSSIGGAGTSGEDMEINDGLWYTLPGSGAGLPYGDDNRVLIAQITTAGVPEYRLNFQVFVEGDQTQAVQYGWSLYGQIPPHPGTSYPLVDETFGFCDDPEACNYHPDSQMDCCVFPGCTNPVYCNYNPEAGCDDGSCSGIDGCPMVDACNYDPDADCWNSGLCVMPGCMDESACNFDAEAGCDDGSCTYGVFGCTSIYACNYTPESECNDGSCVFPGCADESACNYDPEAACNNPSDCVFDNSLLISLYLDANDNGIWDPYDFDEPALGALGNIYIPEVGVTLYPNDSGEVTSPPLAPGTYTIIYNDPNDAWQTSCDCDASVTVPECESVHLDIGLQTSTPSSIEASGPCCIFFQDIHCVLGFNPGLWILNTGNQPLHGVFTMTYDPVLLAGYHPMAEPFDSVNDGVMLWNIEDHMPGDNILYQCHIHGTDGQYVGETFPFEMQLILWDENMDIWSSQTWTLYPEVVCSYDPNDKYTVPEGYAEPHFIESTQELEYRVRFQNTGNAAAVNVRIEDQLDLETLDLSTFQPQFGSHDYTTCITDEGHITFNFDNIFLPDSASDEPGSQGYVVYRIRPFEELVHGTEINNTAEIYFDFNEPIITNTTLHTIMNCADFSDFMLDSDTYCEGDEVQLTTGNPDYVETYSWQLMGEEFSNEANPILTIPEEGTYYLEQWVTNPVCESQIGYSIDVNPQAQAEVVFGDFICAGELWEVEVETDDHYQWDGLEANEPLEVYPTESYAHEVTFFTDLGCEYSTTVSTTPFPLPDATFTQDGIILTANDGVAWQWYLNGEAIDGATDQSYEAEENGDYHVEVTSDDGCVSVGEAVAVIVIGVAELEGLQMIAYPNPAQEVLHIEFNQLFTGEVRLINAQGALLEKYPMSSGQLQIETSHLSPGHYHLQMMVDDGGEYRMDFIKE